MRASEITADARLALMLRVARPYGIEQFVRGSLAALADVPLTETMYAVYLGQWLERHADDPEAQFEATFAWLRMWRYRAACKTGRWPHGSSPPYRRGRRAQRDS